MKKLLLFLFLSTLMAGCWESDDDNSYSDPSTVEATENVAESEDESETSHPDDNPIENPENDENDGEENLRPE